MNTPIEIGTTLYHTPRYSNKLPDGTAVTFARKVTKITSKHFTTDDGTRWTLSDYSTVSDTIWKRYGDGESYHAEYIRRNAGDLKVVTAEEFRSIWEARNAEKEQAANVARAAILAEGIESVLAKILEEDDIYGMSSEAREYRSLMTEGQLAEYVKRLEYKLADTVRQLKSVKSDMRSIGEQLIRKAEGRW